MSQVILSFFATPDKSKIDPDFVQPKTGFTETPLVVSVGMAPCKEPIETKDPVTGKITVTCKEGNAERFGTAILAFRNPVTQRVLPNLLKSLKLKGVTRVAVVGFSAGRAGVAGLLQHPADRDAIDTVIDLDGLHLMKNSGGTTALPGSLEPWTAFGAQAIDGSHLLVTAHTVIASPAESVFSTNDSNRILYDALTGIGDLVPKKPQAMDPAKLTADTTFDPPAFVRGQAGDTDKKIVSAPLEVMNVGNSWQLTLKKIQLQDGKEVAANGPASHILVAYWIQRAIWDTFLAPRWNAPETCTTISAPTLAHTIIEWGIPGCPGCDAAKNFFEAKGLPYTFKDATDDDVFLEGKKAAEAQGLKADGVPILSIDGKMLLGWNKDAVEKLVGVKSCGTAAISQKDLDADTDLDPRNKIPDPGDPLPPPPPGDGLSAGGALFFLSLLIGGGVLVAKAVSQPKHP